ncbi:lysoplasmalogenase [Luteimonas dalianensis]|uniref:lysoplasmalogenase n=1 Tax=Luteimonas dalianensis TaxID=1148196 RepID=UPI003BEF5733
MTTPGNSRLNLLIVLAAAGAIAGALLGGPWIWLHYVCKPLTTVLILWLAVRAAPAQSARYRMAVAVGLVFSLAGDVLLMLPQDLFVPGLVAFLVAHVWFCVAFFPGARWLARLVALAAFGAVGAVNMVLLLPMIPPPLHAPVLAYVVVLVVMAGLADARAWTLRRDPALARPAALAAVGGALFVLSDSLLAWNRFAGGIPLSPLLVLASYYGALWCIARSVAVRR